MDVRKGWDRRWATVAACVAVLCTAAVGLSGCGGDGSEEAEAQTVRFQSPTSPGPKPFTKPADVKGKKKVDVGSGPFGGTGSDLVCDRELLIKSLKAQPDRLREWARVQGIEPTYAAVARYIRKLKPVTLKVDTRVTNYTFSDGRAVGFQSILQAGTAVLVDKEGKIVVRCRCGNPLGEPVFIPEAKCYGCPPNYTPPEPCDGEECWDPYPDPPPTIYERAKPDGTREPTGGTSGNPGGVDESPSASWNRSSGSVGDAYVFFVEGFAPNSSIAFTLTRPSGVTEDYTIQTDGSGSGQHSFPPTNPDTEPGTYTGVARNPSTGATATATTTFTDVGSGGDDGSGGGGTTTEPETGPGPGGGEESDLPVCDPVQPVEPCRPG